MTARTPVAALRAARRRCAGEEGVTMLLVLAALIITTGLLAAVFTGVNGDVHNVRTDLDQKRAYYAAQAGVSNYAFHLNDDVNYWEGCPTQTNVAVPGTSDGETYSITPMVASTAPGGTTACSTANPIGTMIEASGTGAGTFRIQSTGKSNGISRTITTSFSRKSFLNYIYYTQHETEDPAWGSAGSHIDFITGDSVNGPLHTDDPNGLYVCGHPLFGRNSTDAIETPAINSDCGGSVTTGAPGTLNTQAGILGVPPNNQQIALLTQPEYKFVGKTTFVLSGTTMTVTNQGTTQTMPFPTNGVVYVSSSSGSCTYTPNNTNYSDSGCGNAYVSGNYTSSLTIASDNDIVINGNITEPMSGGTPTGTQELGLVAQNYVRIYHPMNNRTGSSCGSSSNATGSLTGTVTIDAAILAVAHSFIVDNYDCGAQLGTLSVYGAIAQNYRGPVGTYGGSGTGYLKNYQYDNRMLSIEPPYFLNPVSAAWRESRETECTLPSGSTYCT